MPIKLIGTIILLILVTIFAGVNLDNKCDITFIFYTFKDIPVFMTVIISFAIGAVFMLPFTFGRGKKKKCPKTEDKATVENREQPKKPVATESKTLFDFKIKREASKAESEKGKNESGKKSLFGSGKKNSKEEKADSKSENAASADAESTGTPV